MNRTLTALKKHPLLLAGSYWTITGYILEEKQKIPVKGYWRIEGVEQQLNIHIQLQQLDDDVTLLERSCKFFPDSPKLFNNWSEQRNPHGHFEGHVNVVEDTLLLQLESEQKIRSVEAFLRVFETEYELRGTVLQGDRQLGSWVLELLRLH